MEQARSRADEQARVVAVDWSGRRQGERRAIWLAEVHGGVVTRVEDGRTRDDVVDHLVALATADPALVVGMDFSFSLPSWFLHEHGYASVLELWDAAGVRADKWITCDAPPFWGRRGCPRPALPAHFRSTELSVGQVGGIRPKSTFQVSGAGSVGAGSLRGFTCLVRLRAHGFSVWPFDDATPPVVVEVWPRLLTGPVVKSSAIAREAYLERLHVEGLYRDVRVEPRIPDWARTRAVESQDAFDALVSALVMADHVDELRALRQTGDPVTRLEGAIWVPDVADGTAGPSTRTHPSPST